MRESTPLTPLTPLLCPLTQSSTSNPLLHCPLSYDFSATEAHTHTHIVTQWGRCAIALVVTQLFILLSLPPLPLSRTHPRIKLASCQVSQSDRYLRQRHCSLSLSHLLTSEVVQWEITSDPSSSFGTIKCLSTRGCRQRPCHQCCRSCRLPTCLDLVEKNHG